MSELSQKLDEIVKFEQQVQLERELLLKKAMMSDDPDAIFKAQAYMEFVKGQGPVDSKSFFLDPYSVTSGFGYREKPIRLTFENLRSMGTVPIVRAIIDTRKDQVCAFSEPVDNDQQMGWMIRKKKRLYQEKNELTDQDKNRIEDLTNFILNAGSVDRRWSCDSFETFLRKFVKDSLEIDQGTFEVVYSRKGLPLEYVATDGATYRWADLRNPDYLKDKIKVNGYYPEIVQIYQNQIAADFYPWELCMGIRNQNTSIYSNNYGVPELEDLIKIVTWVLYGDAYNGKFFSQGGSPKGILKISGNVNQSRLNEFRQQWQSQVAGVNNAWKTPVIESDKMEWVDLQKSNRDMEFREWNKYLILITCAVFKISPKEVGFADDSKVMFSGGEKDMLNYSKDKGLTPGLKFIQRKVTKYLIEPLDKNYEFVFCGIDPEDELAKADLITKKLSYTRLNEILEENGQAPIKGAEDLILNPTFLQWKSMQMMGSQQSNEYMDEETGTEEGNQYKQQQQEEQGAEETQKAELNPILKVLNVEIDKLIHENK